MTGVFCRECEPQQARMYYSAATASEVASCKSCGDTLRITAAISVGAACGLALLGLTLHVCYRRVMSTNQKKILSHVMMVYQPHVKAKIGLQSNALDSLHVPIARAHSR